MKMLHELISKIRNMSSLQKILRYNFGEKLGNGGYGTVLKAFDTKSKKYVAIKQITDCDIDDHGKPIEVIMLEKVKHIPNVSKIIDWFYYDGDFFIVMEYSEKEVDLFDYLSDVTDYKFNESDSLKVFSRLFKIVMKLFREGIIHRDLKLENILFNPETFQITLIDFAFAVEIKYQPFKLFAGTRSYAPPEFFSKEGMFAEPMTSWNLGCVLFLLSTGEDVCKNKENFVKNPNINFSKVPDGKLKTLLKGMLEKDIEKRLKMEDIEKILKDELERLKD